MRAPNFSFTHHAVSRTFWTYQSATADLRAEELVRPHRLAALLAVDDRERGERRAARRAAAQQLAAALRAGVRHAPPRSPRTSGAPRRNRDRMRPSRRGPSDAPPAASPPLSPCPDLSRGRRRGDRGLRRRARPDPRLLDDARRATRRTTRCTAADVIADLHEIRVVPRAARELDARPPARPRREPVAVPQPAALRRPRRPRADARRSSCCSTAATDSYWHNRADGSVGLDGAREAIPAASRDARRRVAIGGISMGGYGALSLGSRARDFCAVGGQSPALWLSRRDARRARSTTPQDYARNDVFNHPPPTSIGSGSTSARAIRSMTQPSPTRTRSTRSCHVWPGGHDAALWHSLHARSSLRFFARACA